MRPGTGLRYDFRSFASLGRLSVLGVVFAVLFMGPPAAADENEKVNALVQAGIEDFKAEQYLEAVAHFLEAKKIYEDPNLDWNIARGFEEAGDCANAIVWFERVKDRKASDGDDEKKIKKLSRDARKKHKKLSRRCDASGTLAISCVDDEARVTIDGGPSFACPLTIQVSPDAHAVEATLEGGETFTQNIEVAAKETSVVEVPSLKKEEKKPEEVAENNQEEADKPPIQEPPPPVEEDGWFARRGALFWTGLASTVVGGVGVGMAFFFDGEVTSAQDEYNDLVAQESLTDEDVQRASDLKDEASTNETLAAAFLYGGIGLAGVGVTLMIVDMVMDSGSEASGTASRDGVAVSPTRGGVVTTWTVTF